VGGCGQRDVTITGTRSPVGGGLVVKWGASAHSRTVLARKFSRSARSSTSRGHLNPGRNLAASIGIPSVVPPFDEHFDEITFTHRRRTWMVRLVVDKVCAIVGRTDRPEPSLAQLCRSVPRAGKASLYRRATDLSARQPRLRTITQQHRSILLHELWAASRPQLGLRCGAR